MVNEFPFVYPFNLPHIPVDVPLDCPFVIGLWFSDYWLTEYCGPRGGGSNCYANPY